MLKTATLVVVKNNISVEYHHIKSLNENETDFLSFMCFV